MHTGAKVNCIRLEKIGASDEVFEFYEKEGVDAECGQLEGG